MLIGCYNVSEDSGLGWVGCPRLCDTPILEPVVTKKIAHERSVMNYQTWSFEPILNLKTIHNSEPNYFSLQADQPGVPGGVYSDRVSGWLRVHLGQAGPRLSHPGASGDGTWGPAPCPARGTGQPHPVKPGERNVSCVGEANNHGPFGKLDDY